MKSALHTLTEVSITMSSSSTPVVRVWSKQPGILLGDWLALDTPWAPRTQPYRIFRINHFCAGGGWEAEAVPCPYDKEHDAKELAAFIRRNTGGGPKKGRRVVAPVSTVPGGSMP